MKIQFANFNLTLTDQISKLELENQQKKVENDKLTTRIAQLEKEMINFNANKIVSDEKFIKVQEKLVKSLEKEHDLETEVEVTKSELNKISKENKLKIEKIKEDYSFKATDGSIKLVDASGNDVTSTGSG